MEIQRIIQIAIREWENIKVSLELCGNIGEFNSKDQANTGLALLPKGSLLVRNLTEMENKIERHGYFSPEAAYVFAALGSKAGERLGLMDKVAQTFGVSYSWVRTGCLNPYGTAEGKKLLKEMVFFKLFFPLGVDLIWDFSSPMVKVKLKNVFDKFVAWQYGRQMDGDIQIDKIGWGSIAV